MIELEKYRVTPGSKVDLGSRLSKEDGGLDKSRGRKEFKRLSKRMAELQELLYVTHHRGLLVILQAMDAAGKDSTIKSVFGPINPQGCRVHSFKAPSKLELSHDYLWRIHQKVPEKGYIGVFNRSHYEDLLVVRVKNLVDESIWRRRFEHINNFEQQLADEGMLIVKFYLHISKEYQGQRLQRRLDRPDKLWKFNPNDIAERARWAEYRQAYEDCLSRCSTDAAPWYVIPAERRWYRNLLIAHVIVSLLEGLKMRYPEPDFDPATIELV